METSESHKFPYTFLVPLNRATLPAGITPTYPILFSSRSLTPLKGTSRQETTVRKEFADKHQPTGVKIKHKASSMLAKQ